MARTSPLPSHRFLIMNNVTNWLAGIFLFLVLVMFIAVWTVTYTIRRDCQHPYHRELKLFSYWVNIQSGSTQKECPASL